MRPLECKVSLGVALQRGHAQTIYIYIQGKNVPRWRTAHASFIGEQHLYNPRAPPCLASGTTGQSLFFVDAEIPF